MRNTVIDAITELAETNDKVSFVTADLGYSVLENFAGKHPERFYNVGIAEQAMMSVAAGMALSGEIVFVYSIGNFNTLRCMEQIRNDVCYHNANVKIISVGGGLSYGQLGMSHHATEDIAMMRTLPNMTVLAPADPEEARAAALFAVNHDGPSYIRLARRGEPVLYEKREPMDITKVQTMRPGKRVALLGCGPVSGEVIFACEKLRDLGIDAGAYSIPCVNPLDAERLAEIAAEAELIVSVEEHQIQGGLGGAIAEAISSMPHTRLKRLGLPNEFPHIVGSHDYLCDHYGLSAQKIADTVLNELEFSK